MRAHAKFIRLIATAGLFAATATMAQEQPSETSPVTVPPAPESPATATATPARGATMESVRAKFGTPSQEVPAVGEPPITRWEYPDYIVFFEHDRVLHTVIKKS